MIQTVDDGKSANNIRPPVGACSFYYKKEMEGFVRELYDWLLLIYGG